jgi:hypothetical protein
MLLFVLYDLYTSTTIPPPHVKQIRDRNKTIGRECWENGGDVPMEEDGAIASIILLCTLQFPLHI